MFWPKRDEVPFSHEAPIEVLAGVLPALQLAEDKVGALWGPRR